MLVVESCALRDCWCCHQLGLKEKSVGWENPMAGGLDVSHQSVNKQIASLLDSGRVESSRGSRPAEGLAGRAGGMVGWSGPMGAAACAPSPRAGCPGPPHAGRQEREGKWVPRTSGQGSSPVGPRPKRPSSPCFWQLAGAKSEGAGAGAVSDPSNHQSVNGAARSLSPTNVSPGSWKRFGYMSARPSAATFRLK